MVGNEVVDLCGARAFTVTVKVGEAGPQVIHEDKREELTTEVRNATGFYKDLRTVAVLLLAVMAVLFPKTAEVVLRLLLL